MIRIQCTPSDKCNCKHAHMCIVVLTNKVIYANVISHAHRHASCVLSFSQM